MADFVSLGIFIALVLIVALLFGIWRRMGENGKTQIPTTQVFTSRESDAPKPTINVLVVSPEVLGRRGSGADRRQDGTSGRLALPRPRDRYELSMLQEAD